MNLKIKVADIPAEGQKLVWELAQQEVNARLKSSASEALTLVSPVRVNLKLERTGQRVLAKGPISTKFRLTCSRCLEEFDQPIAESLFVVFSPRIPAEGMAEENAGSMNEEYYNGEEIDIWPIIKENLFLSIPIKPVCRDNCRGLCPKCGQKLNSGECGCSRPTGHPGMAKLKQIRDMLKAMDS